MSAGVELALHAVELARRAGASDADAGLGDERRAAVTVREDQIDALTESASRTLNLRVFAGQRTATVQSADLAPDALVALAGEAVALAKLAEPDPCVGLPDVAFAAGTAVPPGLDDPELFDHPPEAAVALARRAEAAARGHDPRITAGEGASLTRWRGTYALANSRGFAGEYGASGCELGVAVVADDAENKKREGWWVTSDRRWAGLMDAEEVGRIAAERALRQLGARKVPTQEAPVVWSPEMARELVDILAGAATGDARYRGLSFLIDREGDLLASPLVTLVDDATLPGRLGSRPFDGEGLPSRRTPLIAAGRFEGFLYDAYTARKAGRVSTANADRSPHPFRGVTVRPAPSNLALAAGETAPEAIVAGVDRGLYLTELLGHGENLTTGDFSRGAAGIWIEGGELAYPVTEINVAGRLQQMLADVDAVGTDLTVLGALAAPTLRIARMMIGGS